MSIIPEAVTVRIPPGRTIGPETYNDGYMVVPLVAASLVRIMSSDRGRVREPFEHVAGKPYCYMPEPGSQISIENVGAGESAFQKYSPYPCPIPEKP